MPASTLNSASASSGWVFTSCTSYSAGACARGISSIVSMRRGVSMKRASASVMVAASGLVTVGDVPADLILSAMAPLASSALTFWVRAYHVARLCGRRLGAGWRHHGQERGNLQPRGAEPDIVDGYPLDARMALPDTIV
ncbi:hypothetical protein [Bradyrhizobium sp.]|uniref:hypothetical protein n=1 Tax=Bradyrhizobium sp. TaxID=376 RepID=UPI003C3936E4